MACAATASNQPKRSPVDVYDDLLKLKELVDKGILTEAEFEAQKKKLLEST
ncbi:MAG: SHOCT domain-containing protein [Woeseiaceae bacterium]|nr:SHOCT domain-containing protein [Woeseiaceae bacterium]